MINHDNLFINWTKTKLMFLNCKIKKNDISLYTKISNFKAFLRCTIDNKLTFQIHFKTLKSTICGKLFPIKNLFFLSFDIKLHFFKTFFLPHFDYFSSLFVYYSGKSVNILCKLYNFCLFVLLKLELKFLFYEAQQKLLLFYVF